MYVGAVVHVARSLMLLKHVSISMSTNLGFNKHALTLTKGTFPTLLLKCPFI